MPRRFAPRLALLLLLLAVAAGASSDPRRIVLEATRSELKRSLAQLRLPGYEAPYFLAFAVRDYTIDQLEAKFGAVYADDHRRARHAYVEVRVGDYRLDNTSPHEQAIIDLDADETYQPSSEAPVDDAPAALRSTLWLLADAEYKQALADYANKRGRRATTMVEDEDLPSFSREAPIQAIDPPLAYDFDRARLLERARRASARFQSHADIFDAVVRIEGQHVTRTLVNSEGSEIISERVIFSAHLAAWARAPDGMLLEHERAFYGATPADLPDDEALAQAVDQLGRELAALRLAPVIDPYTGPAILMQQAAGVFFHEAVGHRLEGERQGNEKDGRTFKDQIGRRILPEFLTIVDDPTLRSFAGVPLNGYYLYDDEGVGARPVTLVERGLLRDYIMSRTPISGSLKSNGHGRAEGTADPMGRMANLVVRSTKQVSEAELKRMLLEEVRRQGKPFGLLIRDISGGATNTSAMGFQAFKGQARLVYRVDGKTGAESLVRGVEMVGTPLISINKIVATSDRPAIFNGFCGAESGYVPVSTVAPAVLLREIELQRSHRALERPPLLPSPSR